MAQKEPSPKSEQVSSSDSDPDNSTGSDSVNELITFSDFEEKIEISTKMSNVGLTKAVAEALEKFESSFKKAREQELKSPAKLQ